MVGAISRQLRRMRRLGFNDFGPRYSRVRLSCFFTCAVCGFADNFRILGGCASAEASLCESPAFEFPRTTNRLTHRGEHTGQMGVTLKHKRSRLTFELPRRTWSGLRPTTARTGASTGPSGKSDNPDAVVTNRIIGASADSDSTSMPMSLCRLKSMRSTDENSDGSTIRRCLQNSSASSEDIDMRRETSILFPACLFVFVGAKAIMSVPGS